MDQEVSDMQNVPGIILIMLFYVSGVNLCVRFLVNRKDKYKSSMKIAFQKQTKVNYVPRTLFSGAIDTTNDNTNIDLIIPRKIIRHLFYICWY